MSVAGLCGICQLAEADHRCSHCGTFVCEDHYRAGRGVCAECAGPTGGDRLQF